MLNRSLTHRSDTVVRRRIHQANTTFSGAHLGNRSSADTLRRG